VEIPAAHAGGSGQTPPPEDKDSSKPTTSRALNVDELTSELKVIKLQEKIAKLKKNLKSKKTKVQELSSSSSSNEEGDLSSSNESIKDKKAKKKNRAKPSYNTTSFNYDSLPSNHSFTFIHVGKLSCFDGMNYAKWRHMMKVHLMLLNPSI
jgi:hypothetical protein